MPKAPGQCVAVSKHKQAYYYYTTNEVNQPAVLSVKWTEITVSFLNLISVSLLTSVIENVEYTNFVW